ncbi:MAG: hypothetical protein ACKO32_10395 [Planctomycetia bacterium]
MKLFPSLFLALGVLISLLLFLQQEAPKPIATTLAPPNSVFAETHHASIALESSEPALAAMSTTSVAAPTHGENVSPWKKSGRLTQAEIDYRLTELQKMQAVFEHALLEPGQSQIGQASMFFGMCMAYTLDARGEAIIVPEGVTYTYPPEIPGVWHCSFDGRFYSFLAAEFPEQSQIKALRAEHETWLQERKAGEAIGPEPTVPPDLIASLLEKASNASMELKAARPQ